MSIHRHLALFRATTCLCSVMGPLLLAAGSAHAQQTVFVPTISIRELYTDNVTLTDTNKQSDFITTTTAGLTVTRQSPRVQLYLNGTASYDKYADRTELDGFRPSVLGVATAEVLENRLFLDTRISVVERAVRRTTPGPAVRRTSPRDQTRITNYSVTPQLVHDFDGHAQVQIRAGYSAVNFGKTAVSPNTATIRNTSTFNASASFASSWRASRVRWQLNNSYLENNRSNRQISVDGVLEYALKQGVVPFVRIGYDDIKDRFLNNRSRSGLVYSAGLSWIPGSRLSFRGEIGKRFGGLSGSASVDFAVNSAMRITVRYSEGVSTQQQALTNSLGLLQFSSSGSFSGVSNNAGLVDNVGAPAQLGNNTLSLTNSSFQSENLTVGINGSIFNTSYFVRAYRIVRRFDATATTPKDAETVAGVSGQLRRQFDNGVALNLASTYSETLNPRFLLPETNRMTARARLSYTFNAWLSSSVGYNYSNLQTRIGDAVENAITASLFLTF